MYSDHKYLFQPAIHCISKNDKLSGGFPHSDIHGSKPIPGSPWLNAGYHVLHRLLLPRHPPNALFALDLIRKEQGSRLLAQSKAHLSRVKSCILSHRRSIPKAFRLVSVLDLEQYRPWGRTPDHPLLGTISDTDVVSL